MDQGICVASHITFGFRCDQIEARVVDGIRNALACYIGILVCNRVSVTASICRILDSNLTVFHRFISCSHFLRQGGRSNLQVVVLMIVCGIGGRIDGHRVVIRRDGRLCRFELGYVDGVGIIGAGCYVSNLTGEKLCFLNKLSSIVIFFIGSLTANRHSACRRYPGICLVRGEIIRFKISFLFVTIGYGRLARIQIGRDGTFFIACASRSNGSGTDSHAAFRPSYRGVTDGCRELRICCCCTRADGNTAGGFRRSSITHGYAAAAIQRIFRIIRFRTSNRAQAESYRVAAGCLCTTTDGNSRITKCMGIKADGYR